ncbi:Na+/H+ antiporter, putative [Eimeria acervulina]|uniref:Na+/H+ antiporter, putative n=1 Tax=Eimeria acervulina TaxID=5801 RepID=U6GKI9_EIMAC|nr:Na+/H+ antiporter, putative [Eimeria acervulina]CDI80685.1 Na+/H+ antiporter, putative [Eimeria acervulina]
MEDRRIPLLGEFARVEVYGQLEVRVTDSAATAASTATAVSAATAVSKADSTTANFACNGLCGGVSLRRLSDGGGDVSTGAASIPIAPSLAFFSFLFFFAIFLQWLVSKIPVYPPPVSIIWFVFGMAAYGVASIPALLPPQPWETPGAAGFVETPGGYHAPLVGHNILQTAILETRFIDSSIVYYVMMPILLYEATQNINWHKFKKFFAGGLTLAVLGVAVQVGVLGVLFYYTFISKQWKDMAWIAAFLLAATLSSTDPVAVLSVLNAVNASDKLCTMFDGESLINDGSAVLLFQFFFFLLQGVMETPFSTFLMFVKLLFVGPAFGVAVGFLGYFWLLFFRRHPLTQCLAYITFCYISYFLAEAVFSLSGPLTAVCYGLFIKAYGHIALDRDAQTKHHTFVAALALMANCTIFIVSGIVTYGMMSSVFTKEDGQCCLCGVVYEEVLY